MVKSEHGVGNDNSNAGLRSVQDNVVEIGQVRQTCRANMISSTTCAIRHGILGFMASNSRNNGSHEKVAIWVQVVAEQTPQAGLLRGSNTCQNVGSDRRVHGCLSECCKFTLHATSSSASCSLKRRHALHRSTQRCQTTTVFNIHGRCKDVLHFRKKKETSKCTVGR